MDTFSLFIERRNRIGDFVSFQWIFFASYAARPIQSKHIKETLDRESFQTRLKIMSLKYFHAEAVAIISSLKFKSFQSVFFRIRKKSRINNMCFKKM